MRLITLLGTTLVVTGCVATSTVEPGTGPGDIAASEQIEKYRNHFKRQSLPYINPLGCNDDAPCSLAADFNNDGVIDYAALYEYSGSKRRGASRYIDLILVYSVPDSEQPRQQIFTHIGYIDENSRTQVSLEIQESGILKLPIGQMQLDNIGVNVIYGDRPNSLFAPTFYWDGEKFYSIVKEAD